MVLAASGVDWNEVTAIATSVLTLGVFIGALGVRATRIAAQEDLAATRSAAKSAEDAARRQVEASYRPLLIEVLRNGPITPDMEAFENPNPNSRAILPKAIAVTVGNLERMIDPRLVLVEVDENVVYASFPLRNVGRGLAEIKADAIGVVASGVEAVHTSVARPRVPPEETTRIDCSFTLSKIDKLSSFEVVIGYHDLSGEEVALATVFIDKDESNDWRIHHIEQDARGDRFRR